MAESVNAHCAGACSSVPAASCDVVHILGQNNLLKRRFMRYDRAHCANGPMESNTNYTLLG